MVKPMVSGRFSLRIIPVSHLTMSSGDVKQRTRNMFYNLDGWGYTGYTEQFHLDQGLIHYKKPSTNQRLEGGGRVANSACSVC